MIKVENIEVWGFGHVVRSMRNPLDSWAKSDSDIHRVAECSECEHYLKSCHKHILDGGVCFHLGDNDLDLMRRLYKAGSEHRKYLRQLFVSMDVTAPLYWWKEEDQYKIGTTTNSCSTMHTLTKKPISLDDFSIDDLDDAGIYKDSFLRTVDDCEKLRKAYVSTGDKQYWRWLIQLLPESFNQMRTLTMNYENVVSMIHQRSGHKLQEWRDFVEVLKDLPYVKEIME